MVAGAHTSYVVTMTTITIFSWMLTEVAIIV